MALTKSGLSVPLEPAISPTIAPFEQARFVDSGFVVTVASFEEGIIGEIRENAAKAIINGILSQRNGERTSSHGICYDPQFLEK